MPAYKSGFPKKNLTVYRSSYFRAYASAAGNIDVIADGPENGNDTPNAEIHVLGGGDVAVERVDGDTVTIPGVPGGYVLPISVKRILAAGTTATNFLVLY